MGQPCRPEARIHPSPGRLPLTRAKELSGRTPADMGNQAPAALWPAQPSVFAPLSAAAHPLPMSAGRTAPQPIAARRPHAVHAAAQALSVKSWIWYGARCRASDHRCLSRPREPRTPAHPNRASLLPEPSVTRPSTNASRRRCEFRTAPTPDRVERAATRCDLSRYAKNPPTLQENCTLSPSVQHGAAPLTAATMPRYRR